MTDDPATPPDPAPETTYDLTLRGAGVTIERKVPESIALTIIATVMGGAPTGRLVTTRGGPLNVAQPAVGGVALTPGEYLSSVEAKRNPDKILAFGAYLMDHMGRETFTRDEVRAMFQRAAEAVPGNYHRDFTWAVSNRWLGEQPGTPGAYYVTRTGRDAINGKFGSEVKAATKQGKGRRRTRKAAAATGEEAGDK
jgi:hypothetical protein